MAAELTPVEQAGPGLWLKREDLFEVGGVRGGKARACLALAKGATRGLTTAGSRSSPQVNIVAHVAKHLGLRCVAYTPCGELGEELQLARQAGAVIRQVRPGHNTVIIARAREYAELVAGWVNIPFGMECWEAVVSAGEQVQNIPPEVRRIVVPVGSGMSFAGVLHGVEMYRPGLRVLGVSVGADPTKRLMKYAPPFWERHHRLVTSKYPYKKEVRAVLGRVLLDPIYEAKCVEFLRKGDLLWVVGARQSITKREAHDGTA